MGLKQFNQDLAASRAISISAAVSNIRRGDSDGEAVFTWSSSNDVATSLDVQVLVLGEYNRLRTPLGRKPKVNVPQMSTRILTVRAS